MKKLLSGILFIVFITVMIVIPAYARWNVTFSVEMGQSYDATTGLATVIVIITPNADSADYDINIALERKSGSNWIIVASWNHQTGSGADFKSINQTSYASSGYTYRVHVTGIVDDGVGFDNLDQYSNSKVY
jgi:hypothetical protein